MTSVVFVHGTGVREKAYERRFARVSRAFARVRPDIRVVRCFWGDAHGARLGLGGVSLPVRGKDRGFGADDTDDPLALWSLLEADPLAELHAFAEAAAADEAGGGSGFALGRRDPWEGIAEHVRDQAREPLAEGDDGSDGTGGSDSSDSSDDTDGSDGDGALEGARQLAAELAPFTGEAADRVAGAISLALGGVPYVPGIEPVAARAVLALALCLAEDDEAEGDAAGGGDGADEPLPVDGADRDILVRRLADRLGGTDRGATGTALKWTGGRLATPFLWPMSSAVRRTRGRLTGAAVPAGGDILRYQARGEAIRAAIVEAVRTAAEADPGPVVLLAHSLGGIACVDLFAGRNPEAAEGAGGADPVLDRVALLATVGSQAPFLYELDALTALGRGEPLPAAFPRWLNFYDERDLLGFVGSRVFPGRVTDVRVDTRQPFPRAHSAYFAHRPLYKRLAAELP
ncbi:hypothetical protein ACIOHE_14165 [Streptomyces sp. NPDC087851]|uniref:hypothetical protein n=1 Tax=Streptomyces sp. NPDC087851 TaxID=3365810 RepID=UPI00380F40E7